jgi:hypothetical protein
MTRWTFISLLFLLASCKSTKDIATYEKVKNGEDLEKITLISFDEFFNQWVFNKKIQKIDLNIQELNTDEIFSYFGKPKGLTYTKWALFKVHKDTIAELFPNYKDFYGTELKEYLWNKIIPKEDIELWNYSVTTQPNRIKSDCSYKKNKPIYKFSLINKKVFLTMTWDIECKELDKLKNKTYIASYNLLTKEYENNSTDNP